MSSASLRASPRQCSRVARALVVTVRGAARVTLETLRPPARAGAPAQEAKAVAATPQPGAAERRERQVMALPVRAARRPALRARGEHRAAVVGNRETRRGTAGRPAAVGR